MHLENIISKTDKYINLWLETLNSFSNKILFIHYILIRVKWQVFIQVASFILYG